MIATAASGLNTVVKIWTAPNHTPSMRTRNPGKASDPTLDSTSRSTDRPV